MARFHFIIAIVAHNCAYLPYSFTLFRYVAAFCLVVAHHLLVCCSLSIIICRSCFITLHLKILLRRAQRYSLGPSSLKYWPPKAAGLLFLNSPEAGGLPAALCSTSVACFAALPPQWAFGLWPCGALACGWLFYYHCGEAEEHWPAALLSWRCGAHWPAALLVVAQPLSWPASYSAIATSSFSHCHRSSSPLHSTCVVATYNDWGNKSPRPPGLASLDSILFVCCCKWSLRSMSSGGLLCR